MLDHISFGVADLTRAIVFYDTVLAPLGFTRVWTLKDAAGYGLPGQDEFFAIREQSGEVSLPAQRCHVAFSAPTRLSVQRFHAAATELGAVDQGSPGICPEYGDAYFAAFVRDPDGYRIEAVCHV